MRPHGRELRNAHGDFDGRNDARSRRPSPRVGGHQGRGVPTRVIHASSLARAGTDRNGYRSPRVRSGAPMPALVFRFGPDLVPILAQLARVMRGPTYALAPAGGKLRGRGIARIARDRCGFAPWERARSRGRCESRVSSGNGVEEMGCDTHVGSLGAPVDPTACVGVSVTPSGLSCIGRTGSWPGPTGGADLSQVQGGEHCAGDAILVG
jgi:hypothetical protein